MKDRFFPALLVGSFPDAHTALACVGITGHLADMFAGGMNDDPGQPVAYKTEIADFGTGANTVLVLAPIDGGVRLCYGYLDLSAESAEAAVMRASLGLLPYLTDRRVEETPTLYDFPIKPVRRTLQ